MSKTNATAAAVKVSMLSMLKMGDPERLPLAKVTVGTNYTRPGWNALSPTGVESLAEHMAAVGQMNPCLAVEGKDGALVLVAGFRRYAALSMLAAKGKGDGTVLVRRVMTHDPAALPQSAVPALVNLVENEDAKVATGVAGRLEAYAALRAAGLSAARIASLTGQSAVDYVADTLRLIDPAVDPRFLMAVRGHEEGRGAFVETVKAKGPDGKETEKKLKGQTASFGLVRLIVRAPEFLHNVEEAKAGDKFTAWEVFRAVASLPIAKATPVIASMKAGRAAVRRAEEEAEQKAAAEKAEKAGGKERGAGDNEESTVSADDFREAAATLTVPVLLDIRTALSGEKPNVSKALDIIARAMGKGGAFVKAYGQAYVDEAAEQ